MTDLLLRLFVAAAFTLLIMAGVAVAGSYFPLWAAGLVSVGVVFGGMRIIDGRTRRRRWRS